MLMSTMTLVHMREGLVITSLDHMQMHTMTLAIQSRRELVIAAVLYSREWPVNTTLALYITIAACLYSREGLIITTLAYMEMLANTLEKDTITLVLMGMPTVMVLYSRMDPTIATVWMKKLRQRGLI